MKDKISIILNYINQVNSNLELSKDEKYDIIEELEIDLQRMKLWQKIEINYDNC